MDSNARKGFLLGLAIILVIVLIINGPPFIQKCTNWGSSKPAAAAGYSFLYGNYQREDRTGLFDQSGWIGWR